MQSPEQIAQSIITSHRDNWQGTEADWVSLRSSIAQQIALYSADLQKQIDTTNQEIARILFRIESKFEQHSGLGDK